MLQSFLMYSHFPLLTSKMRALREFETSTFLAVSLALASLRPMLLNKLNVSDSDISFSQKTTCTYGSKVNNTVT